MNTPVFDGSGRHYLEIEFRDLMRDPTTSFFLDQNVLDGFWYWDLTKPEHEWMSPGFWRALGFDPDLRQHLASEWKDLIFPEDERAAKAKLAQHCEDPTVPYDQLLRYQTSDGGTVLVRSQGKAIREDGVPTRMLGVNTIIKDAETWDVDHHMTRAVDMSADAIVVWSMDEGVVRWNEGATRLYGFDDQSACAQDPNALTEAVYEGGWDLVMALLDDHQEWSGEVKRQRSDGSLCVTSSRLQRLPATDERTLILQIDRDITEKHTSEARQAVMSRELNHRVKNLFSVIQGLVGMSSRHETDVREFGDKIMARIKALATAHLLGMEDQSHGAVGDYLDLRDLITVILNPYWAVVEGSRSQGPSVHLPKRIINPLALILHELATNALKHGAWSPDGNGTVLVDWGVIATDDPSKMLQINWRETLEGTKMNKKADREAASEAGFGSKLIDMSVRQLDATLKRTWEADGLSLSLSFVITERAG